MKSKFAVNAERQFGPRNAGAGSLALALAQPSAALPTMSERDAIINVIASDPGLRALFNQDPNDAIAFAREKLRCARDNSGGSCNSERNPLGDPSFACNGVWAWNAELETKRSFDPDPKELKRVLGQRKYPLANAVSSSAGVATLAPGAGKSTFFPGFYAEVPAVALVEVTGAVSFRFQAFDDEAQATLGAAAFTVDETLTFRPIDTAKLVVVAVMFPLVGAASLRDRVQGLALRDNTHVIGWDGTNPVVAVQNTQTAIITRSGFSAEFRGGTIGDNTRLGLSTASAIEQLTGCGCGG